MGYRESLRDAVKGVQSAQKPKKTEAESSQRIADRIRENVIWPEKSLEVKKQKRINEVKEEARDGTG